MLLNRCETWSLTLREERKLRVFEERIMRRIFVSKMDVNVEWKRLKIVDHSLYGSPNIFRVIQSRRLRWAGHVARMEEDKIALKC